MSASTESELINKILATVDQIDGKTTDLQDQINGNLHWLPSGLQAKVVTGWNQLVDLMKNAWAYWRSIAAHLGSPSRLTQTANQWSDNVGAPVSAQAQTADAGSLLVDDNWDGDAADAYRQTLPQQKAALDKIKSAYTDGISSALSQVSTAIIVFWVALIAAFASLLAGFIGAILSAGTIFGLPAAPFIAAAAALVACVAIFGGMANLTSACSSADVTLRQKLDDNTAFRDGRWPIAAKY